MVLLAQTGLSQTISQDTTIKTLFDWVSQRELSTIKIEVDLEKLEAMRRTNEYLPAKVFYQLDKKKWEEWELEVRSRGKFRRLKCDFPPLKLNFSKKKLKNAGFKPYDEFKLVTHCLEDENGKEIVLREYLTYKLYRILTNHSFRAHLSKIEYKDSQSRARSQHYGVLLEPEKELRKRLDAKNCKECFNADTSRFDRNAAETLALFQYMIGNTDFSLAKLHNVYLMVTDTASQTIVPVPYDFDFCGLVDAPYALPNPDLKLSSTRDRLYLGFSRDAKEMEKVIKHFKSKKEELIQEVTNFKYLSKTSRKDILQFLEDFFDELEQERIITSINQKRF